MSHQTALSQADMLPIVTETPLLREDNGGPTNYKAIISDGHISGVVGKGYYNVYPRRFCEIWDEAVDADSQVDVYRSGSIMSVRATLPDMTIDGSLIRNRLYAFNPMDGGSGIRVFISGLNMVCINQLLALMRAATAVYRIKHTEDAEESLLAWLRGIWSTAETRVGILQQAYEIMAEAPVTDDKIDRTISLTYQYPDIPEGFTAQPGEELTEAHALPVIQNEPHLIRKQTARNSTYHANVRAIDRARLGLQSIWQKDAVIGFEPGSPWTQWKLWQAFTQYESRERPTRGDNLVLNQHVGDRAYYTQESFKHITAEAELVPVLDRSF